MKMNPVKKSPEGWVKFNARRSTGMVRPNHKKVSEKKS